MGGFSSKDASGKTSSTNFATNSSSNQATQQANSATTLLQEQLGPLQQLWGEGGALLNNDMGIAEEARGAYGQAVSGTVNPGVADVIANASREMGLDFTRSVLPAIRRGAVGTGSLGGSRQGIAEGLAAGEFARAQGNMSTQLYTSALDQAKQERMGALSLSQQMQALPWAGIEAFGRSIGAPIMQSFGSSNAASSGTGYGLTQGSSTGKTNEDSFGINVLGKGGTG